ncbi:MAG: conjugative transposon protein TraK [Bacteroidetes bacterium]|nr:MAG: conjugative transposon protein TraK [Bacteroidota bacterium]
MFQSTKNIDTAFRHIRAFSILFLLGCIGITCFTQYRSFVQLERNRNTIYILANGELLKACAVDRKDKLDVEIRHHVSEFHLYFFTLDPDEKIIDRNITKALYLADASAKAQYDNLKESGYYTSLISGNISQRIEIDSIEVNLDTKPFYFRCYAKEKLIRTTSILTRSLLTEGLIRDNLSQSDNNPHGFLIERWLILENKDLKTEPR